MYYKVILTQVLAVLFTRTIIIFGAALLALFGVRVLWLLLVLLLCIVGTASSTDQQVIGTYKSWMDVSINTGSTTEAGELYIMILTSGANSTAPRSSGRSISDTFSLARLNLAWLVIFLATFLKALLGIICRWLQVCLQNMRLNDNDA